MTLRRRHFLVGASLSAATIAASRRAIAQDQGPIKIGLVHPLSGSVSALANAVLLGEQIAADEINKSGGILGRPIQLLVRDDQLKTDLAIAICREFASQGCRIFLGPILTSQVLAVMPLLSELNALMTSSATGDQLTHKFYVPNYFRVGANNYMRMRTTAKLMAQRYPDVTSWGGLVADNAGLQEGWEAFSDGLREFYPSIAKKDVLIDDPIILKLNATEFHNEIGAMLSRSATGYYLGYVLAPLATFFQQASGMGLGSKVRVYTENGFELELGRTFKKNTPKEIWSPSFWYPDAQKGNSISAALYSECLRRTGEKLPSAFVGLGSAFVTVFAAGIEKARSTDTAMVRNALEGVAVQTCMGLEYIRKEDHQGIGDFTILRMGPADNDAGFAVTDAVNVSGQQVADAPTPGVSSKF